MSNHEVQGWTPSNTFANRLVLVRRELGGMSVKAASARCGLNYATWSTWENGRTPANMGAVVEAIAAGLGVDRDWLMWGEAPAVTADGDPQRLAGLLVGKARQMVAHAA